MNREYKNDLAVWSREVKKGRAACVICCKKTDELHAHHIFSKSRFPLMTFWIINGAPVCHNCHKRIHRRKRQSSIIEYVAVHLDTKGCWYKMISYAHKTVWLLTAISFFGYIGFY
jgi:hypothetical protein